MSEESKKKVSLSKKGTQAWNKGLPMSEETKKKLSLARKGKPSPWKGKTPSEETRMKMRLAKLGKPSPRKGTRTPVEVRIVQSESRKKFFLRQNPQYDYILDSTSKKGNKRIRRERLRKFGGSHTKEEWEAMKEAYLFTCPCCKRGEPEIKLTRDHILSLSNGGSDAIDNIQPLCVSCNSKKATKSIRY